MIKIKEVVIVEGRYDKIKLSGVIDGIIIETGGFGIFNDKDKQRLIRGLAEKKGILILTDSDNAGFKIRNFLSGIVKPELIKHAYIPDIQGKEKRKEKPSKEGKLGVEGIDDEMLVNVLKKAGISTEQTSCDKKRVITKQDFYNDGLYGGENSSILRSKLIKALDLPAHLTSNKLLDIINTFLTYEDYCTYMAKIKSEMDFKLYT